MSKTSVSAAVATQAKGADAPKATPALTFDPVAVNACAVQLASADAVFENALTAVAESVARILGTKPTFDHWEGVAGAFRADYVKARGCKEETAAKRWSMVAAELANRFALEKPTKPTAEAQRKATARAKQAKAIEKIVKAHKGNAQSILEEAAKAAPHEVAVYAKAAEVAAETAQKAALKQAKGAEAKLREEAAKLLGAASGALLERMVVQLRQITAEARAVART